MPRPEKIQAVADIKERIEGAQAVFLAEYSGLSVAQQQKLRRALKEQTAEFKVVKMTLARRAAAELDVADLDELLLGPTGLAYADGDPVGAAKVLSDFAKEHESFVVKGGLFSGEVLTPERVSELADIEPRDVLLSRIAGLLAAPMSNVAALFGALQQEMAGLLQALIDQRPDDESADAAPVAEDAPDAEEPDDASSNDVEPEADALDTGSGLPAEEADDAEPESAAEADEAAAEPDAPSDDENTESPALLADAEADEPAAEAADDAADDEAAADKET